MVSFIKKQCEVMNIVIPAHAGIHAPNESKDVDPRLRGDDIKV